MPEVKPVGILDHTSPGYFGFKSISVVYWEHCRDRVQVINSERIKEHGMWFTHRKNTGPNVKAFIKKLETQLKIRPKSKFADTEHPERCLWMKVSPWWHTPVRRSFLTLALRSAQNYKPKKDNFLECFKKNKYGEKTMPAINLFLNGHTRYCGKKKSLHSFEGWYYLFNSKSEEQIKDLLLTSNKKKKAPVISPLLSATSDAWLNS